MRTVRDRAGQAGQEAVPAARGTRPVASPVGSPSVPVARTETMPDGTAALPVRTAAMAGRTEDPPGRTAAGLARAVRDRAVPIPGPGPDHRSARTSPGSPTDRAGHPGTSASGQTVGHGAPRRVAGDPAPVSEGVRDPMVGARPSDGRGRTRGGRGAPSAVDRRPHAARTTGRGRPPRRVGRRATSPVAIGPEARRRSTAAHRRNAGRHGHRSAADRLRRPGRRSGRGSSENRGRARSMRSRRPTCSARRKSSSPAVARSRRSSRPGGPPIGCWSSRSDATRSSNWSCTRPGSASRSSRSRVAR